MAPETGTCSGYQCVYTQLRMPLPSSRRLVGGAAIRKKHRRTVTKLHTYRGVRLEYKVKAMAAAAVPSIEHQLAPSTFGMHEFAHSLLATASASSAPRPQSGAIFRFVRPWPALSGLLAGFLATLSESQSDSIWQIVHLWARIAAKSS